MHQFPIVLIPPAIQQARSAEPPTPTFTEPLPQQPGREPEKVNASHCDCGRSNGSRRAQRRHSLSRRNSARVVVLCRSGCEPERASPLGAPLSPVIEDDRRAYSLCLEIMSFSFFRKVGTAFANACSAHVCCSGSGRDNNSSSADSILASNFIL